MRLARHERDVRHHHAGLEQERGLQQERRALPDELQERSGGHHLGDHDRDEVRPEPSVLQEAADGADRVLLAARQQLEVFVARGEAVATSHAPPRTGPAGPTQSATSSWQRIVNRYEIGIGRGGPEVADQEHERVRRRDITGEPAGGEEAPDPLIVTIDQQEDDHDDRDRDHDDVRSQGELGDRGDHQHHARDRRTDAVQGRAPAPTRALDSEPTARPCPPARA